MDECRIGLAALRHALEEFVAPAVDASDPIAAEQLVSGVRYLDFVIDRIDLIHDRERFELAQASRLVIGLLDAGASELAGSAEWARTVDSARATLARPDSRVAELRTSTAELRAAVREILDEASAELNAKLRSLVVADAKEIATFERAWYAPLGFDTDPATLPDIEDVLEGSVQA
ncbi:MAG: hypothetical protein JWO46_2139 [Nocardioidaceae bacterium]|nr:hypothetical protein [Nocardioidaceae bacterium]